MRVVGNVLVVNCDTVTVCVATSGAENVLESSIWIVYELAPVTSLQSKVIARPGSNCASTLGDTSVGAGSVPGGGAEPGETVSDADFVTPLNVAEIVRVVDAETALVEAVNVALV
jgi:hypothetical protein